MAELNDRCFYFFTAAMLYPSEGNLHDVSTDTKLFKFGWKT